MFWVILSLGAINALIPLLIILILIIAAAGSTRGYSIFSLFGFATLAGIGTGGKASVRGKTSLNILMFLTHMKGFVPLKATAQKIITRSVNRNLAANVLAGASIGGAAAGSISRAGSAAAGAISRAGIATRATMATTARAGVKGFATTFPRTGNAISSAGKTISNVSGKVSERTKAAASSKTGKFAKEGLKLLPFLAFAPALLPVYAVVKYRKYHLGEHPTLVIGKGHLSKAQREKIEEESRRRFPDLRQENARREYIKEEAAKERAKGKLIELKGPQTKIKDKLPKDDKKDEGERLKEEIERRRKSMDVEKWRNAKELGVNVWAMANPATMVLENTVLAPAKDAFSRASSGTKEMWRKDLTKEYTGRNPGKSPDEIKKMVDDEVERRAENNRMGYTRGAALFKVFGAAGGAPSQAWIESKRREIERQQQKATSAVSEEERIEAVRRASQLEDEITKAQRSISMSVKRFREEMEVDNSKYTQKFETRYGEHSMAGLGEMRREGSLSWLEYRRAFREVHKQAFEEQYHSIHDIVYSGGKRGTGQLPGSKKGILGVVDASYAATVRAMESAGKEESAYYHFLKSKLGEWSFKYRPVAYEKGKKLMEGEGLREAADLT